MNLRSTKTQLVVLGFVLQLAGAPVLAGNVILTGTAGNTCTSYTNFSVDNNGNLSVVCNDLPTGQPTPTSSVTPSCTLKVSPATINPGASSTLTAVCFPAATAYIWTGPGMSGFSTTSSTGTVRPTDTSPYSVTGINNVGTGSTDTKVVTVSASVLRTGAPPTASSPLAEIKAWNYAFETLNHIPHNLKESPVNYMNYLKVVQPGRYKMPTNW